MEHSIAFIGYGGMAVWHHNLIQEKLPELIVRGAYDIRPEIREDIRKKGLYAYETAEELLADGSVDLVIIAVPNNFHKDYSIACMRAGKNVICEKPVTNWKK